MGDRAAEALDQPRQNGVLGEVRVGGVHDAAAD
jgi:hypothetical protein